MCAHDELAAQVMQMSSESSLASNPDPVDAALRSCCCSCCCCSSPLLSIEGSNVVSLVVAVARVLMTFALIATRELETVIHFFAIFYYYCTFYLSRRVELAAVVVAGASIAAVYLFNLHAIFNFYAKYFELTANDAHTQAEAQSQSVAEAVAEAMSGGTHTHWDDALEHTHVASCRFTIEIELQNLFASQSLQTMKKLEKERHSQQPSAPRSCQCHRQESQPGDAAGDGAEAEAGAVEGIAQFGGENVKYSECHDRVVGGGCDECHYNGRQ